MDVTEGSVAQRNFTALAEALREQRDLANSLRERIHVLERQVASQEQAITELRGMVYSMKGTGATT
jgi:chaperonin cofactor prefoldin